MAVVIARPWNWKPCLGTTDGGTAETMEAAMGTADTRARDSGWVLL